MPNYHIPLQPGGMYHLLNRAPGDEKLFIEERNYFYFLLKYSQHISPIAQTLAWCLLPNHYHFLVRFKPVEIIKEHFERKKKKPLTDEDNLSDFLMQQFSNWQNGYAKAVNKTYTRKGSLFMDYLRRVKIESDEQMGKTLFYVHKNPVHHGFTKQIGDWPWTSYKEYVTGRFMWVDSREIAEWFGSMENFVKFHQQPLFKNL